MTDNGPDLSGDWDLDPAHTRIGFSAKHAMVTNVRGAFNDVRYSLVMISVIYQATWRLLRCGWITW